MITNSQEKMPDEIMVHPDDVMAFGIGGTKRVKYIRADLNRKWQLTGEKQTKIKKGFMRVYSFKPSSFREGSIEKEDMLPRSNQLTPFMGNRVCDMFIDIPLPPPPAEKEIEG